MKARRQVRCKGKQLVYFETQPRGKLMGMLNKSSLLFTFKRSLSRIHAQRGVARRECFVLKRTSLHQGEI